MRAHDAGPEREAADQPDQAEEPRHRQRALARHLELDLDCVGSIGDRREQRDTVASEHVRLLAAVGVALVSGAGQHDQQHAWVRVRLGATVRATAGC